MMLLVVRRSHLIIALRLIIQQGIVQHRQQYNRILCIFQPLESQRVAWLVAQYSFIVSSGQVPLTNARIGTGSEKYYNNS